MNCRGKYIYLELSSWKQMPAYRFVIFDERKIVAQPWPPIT
jgi:hypothetical protein